MANTIQIEIPGELQAHVESRVKVPGVFSSVDEYVRELIRRDKQEAESEGWLRDHLMPLVETPEEEFVEADAAEVIRRAKERFLDGSMG